MKTIELADAEKLEDAGYILYRMLNPRDGGFKEVYEFCGPSPSRRSE